MPNLRILIRRALAIVALTLGLGPHMVVGFTAKGLDNPTLAYNTGSISDFTMALQFLDIAKHMRPWIGHKPGQWGGMRFEELRAAGVLDENGWPKRIPGRLSHIGTVWAWSGQPVFAQHRKGRYVLTYRGEGTLKLDGDAKVLDRRPGQIVFENRAGESFNLNIHQTKAGNHIRDIVILREDNLALYQAGARFNPNWLKLVQDARVLRFMDWSKTNNSPQKRWRDRPKPGEIFTHKGVPLEYIVQLANEVGADPWFTMPHQANDAYIRAFARYVRDALDPRLAIRVEYSNETWNGAFKHSKWLEQKARTRFGEGGLHDYHTQKATEVAQIWNDVFGPAGRERLVHVMASQAMNTHVTKKRLEATAWKRKAGGRFVPPSETFDELAIASYFGSQTVSKPEMRTELIRAIQSPQVNATRYLSDRLLSRRYAGSIPQVKKVWKQQAKLAKRHGLRLVGYEGGQHVHHSFAVRGLAEEEVEQLSEFMADFVRSSEMGNLYKALWKAWAEVSDGPFMQYTDVSHVSKWGAWGVRMHLDDNPPRARVLDRRNASKAPWWDAKPGAQYRQGVIRRGTARADRLVGTREEDYLLGGPGDDVFEPGPGADGIHGGSGQDEVRLAGSAQMYKVTAHPGHIEVTGAGGRYRLVAVERLRFKDGSTRVLTATD